MTPKKAFVIATLGAIVGSFYTPADAQPQCTDTKDIEEYLKTKFNEAVILEGDHGSGAKIQIFASPDLKTMTFIMKYPNGKSCLLDEAENMRPVIPQQKPVAPKQSAPEKGV